MYCFIFEFSATFVCMYSPILKYFRPKILNSFHVAYLIIRFTYKDDFLCFTLRALHPQQPPSHSNI